MDQGLIRCHTGCSAWKHLVPIYYVHVSTPQLTNNLWTNWLSSFELIIILWHWNQSHLHAYQFYTINDTNFYEWGAKLEPFRFFWSVMQWEPQISESYELLCISLKLTIKCSCILNRMQHSRFSYNVIVAFLENTVLWKNHVTETIGSIGIKGLGVECRIHHHECNFSIIISHIINLNALLLHNKCFYDNFKQKKWKFDKI
jgi:hypothetical protein